jgi:starch phosphorylase
MEFGLSDALPIYSGGLGILAGDFLKSASDLDVPVVGVGLLYQQGYFRQVLDADGGQRTLYPHNDPPHNDPGQLQLNPVRAEDGEWLRIAVELPGRRLWLRTWQAQVGRVTLYLLDTNDPVNSAADRGILGELYGGNVEVRLQQEIVLGIGGWRLLRALGIRPEVCHLNEGHAALVVLERARTFAEDTGVSFATALAVTRAGNLFTTHTPVPAGFDHFEPGLVAKYLGAYADELGIGTDGLLALGRVRPADPSEPLNMAYLAVRGSNGVNGVSRLHAAVSRDVFRALFPRRPVAEVPVGHVTNGVHIPSWESPEADAVWTDACGPDRWKEPALASCGDIRAGSNATLWKLRCTARRNLVAYARERFASQLAISGASAEEIRDAGCIFDPNALTIGFARRFAVYKRPDLLLRDRERLLALLTNPRRPVQLIVAGKAHPHDKPGQELIRAWVQFARCPEARSHVVFLADYDMQVAERLVQGVDVWLNTPRRPMEASGTSGMKVLANGGLNVSSLDGWWDEAYAPEVG